ncbi:hypothetical protein EI94DRAFT_1705416 [Lactarius quietus]|nr:hypothetical protein EI94DRAFT_1705416 [Lactarius quietus]
MTCDRDELEASVSTVRIAETRQDPTYQAFSPYLGQKWGDGMTGLGCSAGHFLAPPGMSLMSLRSFPVNGDPSGSGQQAYATEAGLTPEPTGFGLSDRSAPCRLGCSYCDTFSSKLSGCNAHTSLFPLRLSTNMVAVACRQLLTLGVLRTATLLRLG